MAHPNKQEDTHPPHSGPAFGLGDFIFVLMLVAAMVAVVFAGRFAYREGALLETAKDNAAQFMKWTEAVAAPDGKAEPFTLALCASMPGAAPQEIAAGVAPEGAASAATRHGLRHHVTPNVCCCAVQFAHPMCCLSRGCFQNCCLLLPRPKA